MEQLDRKQNGRRDFRRKKSVEIEDFLLLLGVKIRIWAPSMRDTPLPGCMVNVRLPDGSRQSVFYRYTNAALVRPTRFHARLLDGRLQEPIASGSKSLAAFS